MHGSPWTDEEIRWICLVLGQHATLVDACVAIGKATGRRIHQTNLTNAFLTRGLPRPVEYLKRAEAETADSDFPMPGTPKPPSKKPQPPLPEPRAKTAKTSEAAPPAAPDKFALFRQLKNKPIGFEELCDRLDMSPKKMRELVEEARSEGMHVHFEHGQVAILKAEPSTAPQESGILPVVGKIQRVGVISDTHLGSKYCLRAQLRDFVEYAYHERGVREILHPGDVLDGNYKKNGQIYECSHVGLDAQIEDLYETLPQLPGLTYHAITGNHDETLWADTGHDTGHAIERYFRHPPDGRKPRNDLKFYGNRGAHLMMRGIRVHLWHPRSGKSYARTYHLQKLATLYAGGEKPQLTLAGHWHVSAYCVERGIHMIACPTFQGGGSAFGKSLGGAPEIGGLVLGWTLTEHGTIRDFTYERRAYFEVEGPQSLGLDPGVHVGYGE